MNKTLKLFSYVVLSSASMARTMERESYVTVMIADAQPDGQDNRQAGGGSDGELARGILKREGSRDKKKKVRWADGVVPNSANNMDSAQEAEQRLEQKDESKSAGIEPSYISKLDLARQRTNPWYLGAPGLVDALLSEKEQATLSAVGFEKHHFIERFIDLWPTQEAFQELNSCGSEDSRLDLAQQGKKAQLLAALAAHKNERNDQRLQGINRSRVRLKPYGYTKWPFAIMAVCFFEILIVRAFACPG